MERPTLTDGVVTLRPGRPNDADDVFAACQDRELHRWLVSLPYPYHRSDAVAFLARSAELAERDEACQLVIVAGGRLAGAVGVNGAEMGYWIVRAARGRGLAARAVILLRDWAHAHLGVERIELLIHPDNLASVRAAEKAGFADSGELRAPARGDEPAPHMVYVWSAA